MPTSDVESNVVANTCSVAALLPIMGVVLIAFLVIGLALPVLPLHVHQGLGLSPFIVGLVTGSQFAASLLRGFIPAATPTHAAQNAPLLPDC